MLASQISAEPIPSSPATRMMISLKMPSRDFLAGRLFPKGTLPVTICNPGYGQGIAYQQPSKIPGCAKTRRFCCHRLTCPRRHREKAFPAVWYRCSPRIHHLPESLWTSPGYEPSPALSPDDIFDLASVTKTSATTVSVMKLYEQGKLKLNKTLGDYLPWVKEAIKQTSGLKTSSCTRRAGSFHSFTGKLSIPPPEFPTRPLQRKPKPGFSVRVAENIYMRDDWQDTMCQPDPEKSLDHPTNMCTATMISFFWAKSWKPFQMPCGICSKELLPENGYVYNRLQTA